MAISGYPSTTSVVPGDSINFHLSSDSPGWTNLTVERVGRTSVSANITADLANLSPPTMNPWEGYGWPDTVSFTVPSTWPTGFYRLAHGADDVLTFVVRPANPGDISKILLQVVFLTPTAYNNAGGKSLYGFNSGGEPNRASQVSLDRPGSTPPSKGWEATLIRWLETEAIEIEYCSSIDLHAIPNLLASYDCLVIAGHDEYWTKPMRDQAERFVANGGNMIVLSGNTCYGAVRLEQGNRLVVFHKYAANDTNLNADEASVKWTIPPLNRPQNSFLGVGWTEGAYDGPPTAYKIRFPTHWVFAGVSDASTSPFMAYETDAAEYVDEPEDYPRVTGGEGTPLAFTVLASADLDTESIMLNQTRRSLEDFDNQHEFERLAVDVLNALGYSSVEPMAPRGGADGGRDIKFMEGDTPGITFVTLDKKIREKFKSDLLKQEDSEGIIALFCNVDVSPSLKLDFTKQAIAKGYRLEVFDIERLRSVLDASLKEIRRRYLKIDDEIAARLRSEVAKLLRFPDAIADKVQPPTLIEKLLMNKLPRRLFDLLMTYEEHDILEVPGIGDALQHHIKTYYNFRQRASQFEETLFISIGKKVAVRFAEGWRIYLKYVIMRFAGAAQETIIGWGDFLNYEITWEDAERVLKELYNEPGISLEISDLFRTYESLCSGLENFVGQSSSV